MEFPDNEAFQFFVDPFAGRIVLMIPAPMICFESIEAFKDFIGTLTDAVPGLSLAATASETSNKEESAPDKIERYYAEKVIESWQNLVMESLPKKIGPSLQKTKPNDSTLETGNP